MDRFTVFSEITFFIYDDIKLTEELKLFLEGYAYGQPYNIKQAEVYKSTDEDACMSTVVDGQAIVIY